MKVDLSVQHRAWVNASTQSDAYQAIFWLIEHVFGLGWHDLHRGGELTLDDAKYQQLGLLVKRYEAGEPLAYLIGHTTFMGMDLAVKPGVLIPRVATEALVEAARSYLKPQAKVLECGLGSGAIACALAQIDPSLQLVGVERSDIAFEVAQQNIKALGLSNQIEVLHQSWLEPLPQGFDMLVSNPPYIAVDDPNLAASVREYEPKSAWCSGENGMQDFHDLIRVAKQVVKPGGYVAFEHGFEQRPSLVKAFEDAGAKVVASREDTQGLPRVVVAQI